MEEIKPKKERKFLKAMGDIALTLFRELVLGIGKKVINKVGNKRQGLVITFVILASTFAIAQFPNTGNKQRLGFQTTGDGLVWRGTLSDTASIQPINNQNAWVILDTINLKFYTFDFTSNVWNLVGGALTMPFDSITFNTAKNGTVGVGEVEYNDTQGSLIQGLKGGNVTNVIGQQLHQRVNNRTGAPLAKGDVVYLAGSQGNRITVAKGLAVTDAFSANTFGVVAESIPDNQSGFIITEGLITGLNTSALTEDSAVYLSPTVPGALTSTKPQAPQHTVYIGVCVKSNNGSGELFIKIRNGQELDELHDTRITFPLEKASLYYSGGLWRDTTAALLVSDTASMLSNYATKAYADTTGRLYARQDFTNVSSSTLTWTQSDTLIPGGVNVVQVYRNGQILLPTQYTIPTSTSVVIAASSFKVNDNYTVIFPRGGGAGSGGGSGSLTSISGGTGITVSPNPITTTGTVSADLSVLMELTDTSFLNLSTRFASKLNTTDTASLSNRIDAKGNGTVTSVATGYGLTGGTITTTGTLVLDSAVVFSRIRDSIVDVAIGNDTIKILKQEYAPATTSVLIWTITPKFPIQLKQYILVFRNGQLLINDQYNLTDTNKITIVSNSFKAGANYTVVTVSGIGSVGTGTFPNPVYPDAGIALSTGTTWASSIPNNSSNWNTAFTDRLKWDGGSTGLTPSTGRTSLGGTTIGQSMFTLINPSAITFPRFNADNTVTALSAASFRSAIGAGTVTEVDVSATVGNPISITNKTTTPIIELLSATSSRNGYLTSTDWTTFNGKQAALNGTGFVKASGTTITYDNSNYLTTSSASTIYLSKSDTAAMLLPYFRDADTSLLNLTSRFAAKLNISDTASMLTPYFRDADTTQLNLTSRFSAKLNISDTLNMLVPYLRKADTTLMLSKYLRKADTSLLNLTSRFAAKLNISDTASMLTPYFRDADTTQLNLTSRFSAKLNISDTLNMLVPYLRKADTTLMLSKYLRKADTSLLNLTSRFAAKLNISDTASMLTPYFRDADTTQLNLTSRFSAKLNISDTLNMLVPYLRKADTTLMLSKYLRKADTSLLNLTSRFAAKLNISDTASMLTPYFRDADTTQLNLTSRFSAKLNISDTLNMLVPYLRKADTTLMLSKYLRKADTSLLNLTSRFAAKLNISDTASMLTPYFRVADTSQLNLTSRFAAKQNNISLTTTGTSGAATFNGTTLNIPNYTSSGGTGTVTSVGLTAPSIFTVSGSPVTTSGTLALTYSGTALPLLNGGTGATTADAALTNLGVSVVGKALLAADNSVSDKFIKVNANKTITLLSADDTRTTIGAGTGNGTVTNVSGSGAISVATGTTTPLISVADAAFGTAGIVTASGTQQFSGDKVFEGITQFNARAVFKDYTYVATRLAGLSSTDRFATVTIGSGLSLSSGILSATSGGVTSVTASTPLSSSGGTTPNITITDAGTGASGVVNTTTQSFAGNKTFTGTLNVSSTGTFGGRINTPWLERTYTNSTSSNFTVSVNTTWLDINTNVLTTLTLPNAPTYPGKELHIRQTGTGQIVSFSSNVIPFTSPPTGSAGTAILNPTNNKAVTLVSDGTNWIIMQRSGN